MIVSGWLEHNYLNLGWVMQNVRETKPLAKAALVQAIHNASRC